MLNKKNVLLSILLAFSINCLNSVKAQETQKVCNIKQYSYYTNLAELAIVDSSYNQALSFYDSAFCHILSPFLRDRFNELVCNAITGDYEKCRTQIMYLFGKGLNRDLIRDNQAFSSFLASTYGRDILELNVNPTYNIELRATYDSIFEADQFFRRLHPRNYHDFYNDTINKIDASNVNLMNQLILKYGWPTIDLIGVSEIYTHQYEIIIVHQSDRKYQVYNYAEDIMKAYENCQIEPDKAIYLYTWSNNAKEASIMESGLTTIVYDSLGVFTQDSIMSFQHKTGFSYIPEERMTQFNKERQVFGLESIYDMRRKVLYSLKDKRFIFNKKGTIQTFTITNLKDYTHFGKNLVEL